MQNKPTIKIDPKQVEIYVGVVFSFLWIFLINKFYSQVSLFTSSFELILPLYNTVLVIGIGLLFARLRFRSRTMKAGVDAINSILFLIVAYQFWVVFPFNPSFFGDPATGDTVIRLLIVVPPVLHTIGSIAAIFKLTLDAKS